MSKRKTPRPAATPTGQFLKSHGALGTLDPGACANLLALAADITLLVDAGGTVRDMAFGSESLAQLLGSAWLGQHLSALVGPDSLPKVAALLAEQTGTAPAMARQFNHALPDGQSLPVLYMPQRVAAQGRQPARLLLFGRDQRMTAALQQRLVEAQLSMERDYARFRQAELRYRHLFQVAAEGVLVLDPAGTKVLEANPRAAQLLSMPADKLTGQALAPLFAPASQAAVSGLLAAVRRTGRADPLLADLAEGQQRLRLAASLIHQEDTHLLLVRLAPAAEAGDRRRADASSTALIQALAQGTPDALVVTDPQGRVLVANPGFEALTQTSDATQWQNRSLETWLGRGDVDLAVLLTNLKQRGSVKLFATSLRGEFGATTDVEISAAQLAPGASLGFVIRDVGRRLAGDAGSDDAALPRSVNKLAELVGRVPMKDIVADTTDLIEKRCIETALELTRDNRASAAEILGLSRQSLYVKMRRYGLGDLGSAAQD